MIIKHGVLVHSINKANKCMYSLTLLRRSKVAGSDIFKIFYTKICLILEYASAVWHSGLTDEVTESLESIQARAINIAFQDKDY